MECHICSIVPAFMLKAMEKSEDEDVRAMAAATLQCSALIHQSRQSALAARATASSSAGGNDDSSPAPPPPQGIVPDYMQKSISSAKDADDGTKESAKVTLAISAAIRDGRQKVVDAVSPVAGSSAVPPPLTSGTWDRRVHDMKRRSNERGLPGKLARGEGDDPVKGDAAVNEVYDSLKTVLDFFNTFFNWDSIDGRGTPVVASVHFGSRFANAFWEGKQLVFGDGNNVLGNFTKTIDIIAHEIGHGVVQFNGGLEYYSESGALNEHFADVFGIMVKQYVEKETADVADWLIGEGIFRPTFSGVALRSFRKPGSAYDHGLFGRDLQPSHVSQMEALRTGEDADTVEGDGDGVHIFSGIPNHAFYLVATKFGGYSFEKAGPIWWGALQSRRLPPMEATFIQFADITVDVARNLYGLEEARIVRDAWKQVGVERDI